MATGEGTLSVRQARLSRREFVKGSAAAVAAAATGSVLAAPKQPRELRVGVIGCGGRGTGAAVNALEASPAVRIAALAELFPDRLAACRKQLSAIDGGLARRVDAPDDRCFTGFDAYERLLDTDVDVVMLATPPHFRPIHLSAAVARGKHVFMEKPVAVDPAGVRAVLAAADDATKRGLSIVAGTQRRHERSYQQALDRIERGEIGRIVSASCYWNQGGLWMNPRQPQWSDMEWQLRNWLYFTWLSGDHIVEQHVHNLDVMNWAIGSHPLKAIGMGGRQVRTSSEYGHVFDHFAVEYEYPGRVTVTSLCRQTDGCSGRVEEVIRGTDGIATLSPGRSVIDGTTKWRFSEPDNNPYVQELADLIDAVLSKRPLNEGHQVAESTLTAIMGRMAAYTGKDVTWEQALNSRLDLAPPSYQMGSLTNAEVAVPGRTPLI